MGSTRATTETQARQTQSGRGENWFRPKKTRFIQEFRGA